MSEFKLKCTKFDFGWGSAPDRAEGAYSAPPYTADPLAGFGGPTSKAGGRRGEGGKGGGERKGEGGEGKGRGREGKGRKGRGKGLSLPKVNFLVTSLDHIA